MNLTCRDYWDVQPNVFTKTPEGYLTGRICVTGIGVFTYMDEGGKKRRLRPQAEVGLWDSLQTLNNKPVTFRHPSEEVNPDNVKKLSVGFTGNDVSFDGLNVYVTVTVTDRGAIDAIEAGDLKAVSCGYEVVVDPNGGNWQGVEYDEAMTQIKYNHVALVREGRAGDGVRFTVGDSVDEGERIFNTKQKDEAIMKKIMIDGAEVEVTENVANHVEALAKAKDEALEKVASLETEKATIEAERDAAKADLQKAQDEKPSAEDLAKLVDEKLSLISIAKEKGLEVKATDSAEEIKKAVIKSAYPEMNLDEKPEAYINGLFDAAKTVKAKDEKQHSPLAGAPGSKSVTADEAYAAMCEKLNNKNK